MNLNLIGENDPKPHYVAFDNPEWGGWTVVETNWAGTVLLCASREEAASQADLLNQFVKEQRA